MLGKSIFDESIQRVDIRNYYPFAKHFLFKNVIVIIINVLTYTATIA